MSDSLERLCRLRPDFNEPSPYTSRRSKHRHDPDARAALDLALRHIEIHADRFLRRQVIEAALRIAAPEVTTFRIAADLQRLLLCRVGVFPTSLRLDRAGHELTSSTAMGIKATIALEIDAALGESVFLLKRADALERLAADTERRHVVLAPDRRIARDLGARCAVEASLVSVWIAAMERALHEVESPEPLWRYWSGRALLVDRAWALPNVDVLLVLELCRRLSLDLVLIDDPGRFPLENEPLALTYTRRMPRLPRRRIVSPRWQLQGCTTLRSWSVGLHPRCEATVRD